MSFLTPPEGLRPSGGRKLSLPVFDLLKTSDGLQRVGEAVCGFPGSQRAFGGPKLSLLEV